MFLWALLGYFLLFAAWAVASPYDGTPDEQAHIANAYGVASGQVLGELAQEGQYPGVYRNIPKSLIRDNCFAFHPEAPASCAVPPGGDETEQRKLVHVARYSPAYYLAVGMPIRISPDMTGVLFARLISAAIVAALIAWATSVALTLRRRAVVGGILVAVTPVVAVQAGAINPSGTEIAAGLGLVVGLMAIFFEPDGAGARRSAWWLAGVAGAAMLALRPAGPAWFGVVALVMLLPMTSHLRQVLLRSRRFWTLFATLSVVGLTAVSWTLWRHATDLIPGTTSNLGPVKTLQVEIFDRWHQIVPELIGRLGWLDTPLPVFVYIAWWMAIGTLVALALALGRPADRWRVAGLGALGMLAPSLAEAIQISKSGFINQGRYFLPMLIGVPILAAYVVANRGFAAPLNRLTRLFAVVLLPLHVLVLAWGMIRFQNGMPSPLYPPSLNPLTGSWHPQLGSVTPLLLGVLSAVVLVTFYRRITIDIPESVAEAAPGEAQPVSGVAEPERVTV
ncbi:DUF2142 domain-containing protein [Micromonospora sp. NPDC049523]|uniref:DUF2142 domain-containing protein n=1 Tax=Micromonospora sp. NPDC049523 TaxID=3155921 RepID=UPI00341D4D64